MHWYWGLAQTKDGGNLGRFFALFWYTFLFRFGTNLCRQMFALGSAVLGWSVLAQVFARLGDNKLSENVLIFCRCFGVRLGVECIGIGGWHRQKMGEI